MPAPSASQSPPAASEEAIVPDSQFEEALPPLDPALGQPLEPLEDFDVKDAPPVTAQGEIIPDAPISDPALTEPLSPLATFDVQTPPAGTESEEDAPGPVEPVRYTLEIEGLDQVGLEGNFRDLSALEDADGEATNGSQVQQRADEDELLAVRLLRSEGYYDATAVSTIEQLPEPGRLRVVLTAVPGQRYSFGQIAITGPETQPPGIAREALPLKSGQPIVAIDVEAAEANVRLRLPQQGYPFAEVGLRDILLDPATRLGDYTLPVEPGPRSSFAGFTTEGDLAFDAEHVGVLARFRRGELFDQRKVDDLREAMIATNLFSTVSAEPVRTGETAPDGTEYVNILVRQDAGPARSLAGSVGYSTGEGFRAEGTWEHRNFFPPEGAIRATAIAGTQEQTVRLQFRRANAGKRDRTVLVQAEAGRRDYAAFRGYTARLHGLISRESTPIWQKKWTWAYGAEIIATNESRIGEPELSIGDAFFLAGVTGQLGYDASNSLLDPTRGFRLLGRINPETSLRDPGQPYVRNFLDGSAYFPATDSLTIAGRARVGSIYGAELNELAPSRRIYAGGGGSVRGFGYQELGPKEVLPNPKFDPTDPDEKDDPTILVPTGGRSVVEFALEARYRFGNYGIVPFIDAGQVYTSQYPKLSDLRFGVGIGGRLYTNFGPIRADVAIPLGRREGESKVAVYVSIGQAF
ncbi:autotransporter assembly complex protein TamA [Sphingomonas parva]|nr:BamA/TamA family outer membrane protein [Sphingomonas parva]